ncbi:MAG: hypothetical protein AVDCRST_MAG77-1258 [uncultured Chloroflexi bacterium]|uniref:Uncharacterized protein n=1 Tax=uncultured Chloroflexota bacterium TaxID=166587 RepID=A0A6J4HWL2_9CHLR|nr:MAG: hypothetical protein AVDCRST_MAG77-1258 [uncultured Chloroflexota bacterium]
MAIEHARPVDESHALAVRSGALDRRAPAPPAPLDPAVVEQVVIGGDLARLTPDQRVAYYHSVCQSLGLNPLTQPFEYIRLNDKLRLYAKKDATDQLRRLRGISVEIVSREQQGDLYVVLARATTPDGRSDEAIGAVSLAGLGGANLANGLMRCETKAKRRVTLSICGLGWMDDSEVDSVPVARRVRVVDAAEVAAAAEAIHVGGPPPASARGAHTAAPASEREKLLRRWHSLCSEADALGVLHEPLPHGAPVEIIVEHGRALRGRVEQARANRAA